MLLSDLDFTLAPKKVRRPDQPLRNWITSLHAAGIDFMIVSNNRSGERVREFCAELGVPYRGHAGKPSPRGLEAAMARAGADRAHTAMLGDKLLTDMLAANRAGVLALMVEPAGVAESAPRPPGPLQGRVPRENGKKVLKNTCNGGQHRIK